MELQQLKQQIVNKQISPLYVFTGCEIAIMDIYINKIATVAGATIKRSDSVGSIYSKVQNKGFITTKTAYLIRNDKQYTTQENAWQNLNNGATQGNNIIILIYDNIDKRSKFYKTHQDRIVEFEKLSPSVLAKYIKKEIGLDESYGTDLAEMCDNDYSRILLECDKLYHLSKALNTDITSAFAMAKTNKLIYTQPKDVIFDFVDSVCRRQIQSTYNQYKQLQDNPLVMLSLLYNNMRSMLLVQSAGNGDIASRTGLTPWQIKVAREKGNKYTVAELVRALRVIREAERGIKIGTIEQTMAVEFVLVSIL